MTEDQVPEFVDAILATGCPICAVGHDTYVFAELDVPEDEFECVVKDVAAICGRYGQRDHLRLDITAYLRSIGRHIDCESAPAH